MFMICERMKWAHLPEAGGIYDQHPDLLDAFLIIFHERSEFEAEEESKRQAESKRGMGKGRSKVAGPRR
jgi:hypothetical protein